MGSFLSHTVWTVFRRPRSFFPVVAVKWISVEDADTHGTLVTHTIYPGPFKNILRELNLLSPHDIPETPQDCHAPNNPLFISSAKTLGYWGNSCAHHLVLPKEASALQKRCIKTWDWDVHRDVLERNNGCLLNFMSDTFHREGSQTFVILFFWIIYRKLCNHVKGFNCLFRCACSLENTRRAPQLPLHTSHLTAICAMNLDSQNMHLLSDNLQALFLILSASGTKSDAHWPKTPLNPLPTSIKSPIFNAVP